MSILSSQKEQLSQSPTELKKPTSQKRPTTASGSITPDVYGNISRRKAIELAIKKRAPEIEGPGTIGTKKLSTAASSEQMSSPAGNFVGKIKKMADPKIGKGQKNANRTAG